MTLFSPGVTFQNSSLKFKQFFFVLGSNKGPNVRFGEPPDQLSPRQQPANHFSRIGVTLEDTHTSSKKIKRNLFSEKEKENNLFYDRSNDITWVSGVKQGESHLNFGLTGLKTVCQFWAESPYDPIPVFTVEKSFMKCLVFYFIKVRKLANVLKKTRKRENSCQQTHFQSDILLNIMPCLSPCISINYFSIVRIYLYSCSTEPTRKN